VEEATQTFAYSFADPIHRMINDELKTSTAFALIWTLGLLLFGWIILMFTRDN
jgi:hypothetical protein